MSHTTTDAYSPIAHYFENCGGLNPTTNDVKSWTSLNLPAIVNAATSGVKVGVFGYDITCLQAMCAQQNDYNNYCDFLVGSGINGWSLGVYGLYHATPFYIGQSNTVTGDVVHKVKKGGVYSSCKMLSNHYSITATGKGINAGTTSFGSLYGLGRFCLFDSEEFGYSDYQIVTTNSSWVAAKF